MKLNFLRILIGVTELKNGSKGWIFYIYILTTKNYLHKTICKRRNRHGRMNKSLRLIADFFLLLIFLQ